MSVDTKSVLIGGALFLGGAIIGSIVTSLTKKDPQKKEPESTLGTTETDKNPPETSQQESAKTPDSEKEKTHGANKPVLHEVNSSTEEPTGENQ
jgi:hypothetical protein